MAVWIAVVVAGMGFLYRYKNTPGAAATPPAGWPEGSTISRAARRPTLVMLAHPRCPCTRASLAELARLMTDAGPLDAHVLFLKPAEMADGWERTDLWQRAREIPGVEVASDIDGREAARFGATVSGQVVLYDATGRLLFRGGITGARGHEGDNLGRSRIVSLLRTGTADARQSRVFGCSLTGASSPPAWN